VGTRSTSLNHENLQNVMQSSPPPINEWQLIGNLPIGLAASWTRGSHAGMKTKSHQVEA